MELIGATFLTQSAPPSQTAEWSRPGWSRQGQIRSVAQFSVSGTFIRPDRFRYTPAIVPAPFTATEAEIGLSCSFSDQIAGLGLHAAKAVATDLQQQKTSHRAIQRLSLGIPLFCGMILPFAYGVNPPAQIIRKQARFYG